MFERIPTLNLKPAGPISLMNLGSFHLFFEQSSMMAETGCFPVRSRGTFSFDSFLQFFILSFKFSGPFIPVPCQFQKLVDLISENLDLVFFLFLNFEVKVILFLTDQALPVCFYLLELYWLSVSFLGLPQTFPLLPAHLLQ